MTNPLDILRGTSSNTMRKSKSTVTNVDLTIYDLAQKKADKQEDTSVMSVMLN